MKRLVIILSVLFLSGCAAQMEQFQMLEVDEETTLPELKEERTIGKGDIFFEHFMIKGQYYEPTFVTGESFRYELSVMFISDELLKLQYNEYTKSPTHRSQLLGYTGLRKKGFDMTKAWVHKPGSERRMYFMLKKKVFKFRGFEFEILGYENGQIRYRRIK